MAGHMIRAVQKGISMKVLQLDRPPHEQGATLPVLRDSYVVDVGPEVEIESMLGDELVDVL